MRLEISDEDTPTNPGHSDCDFFGCVRSSPITEPEYRHTRSLHSSWPESKDGLSGDLLFGCPVPKYGSGSGVPTFGHPIDRLLLG